MKITSLEMRLKGVQEQYEIVSRDKTSTQTRTDRRIQDLETKEKRLQDEIDHLKSERDRKLLEFQTTLEKEKESFKQKLNETEKKTKEAEQKKNQLVFEFEKDRAKWMLERDHIENQKNDIIEQRN